MITDMRAVFALLALVILGGCGDTPSEPVLRTPEVRVFVPDDRLFRCPVVSDFPDSATLTDGEISSLLVTLDTNNRICRRSFFEYRKQLQEAKERIENG